MKSNIICEIALLEAEARRASKRDVFERLRELAVPDWVVFRLSRLWSYARKIGNRFVAVGKIVIQKLLDFVIEHPGLTVGVALGVAVTMLASSLPVLGPFLSPIVGLIAIPAGAGIGYSLDAGTTDQTVLTNAVAAAKVFFEFVIDVLRAAFLVASAPESEIC